MGNLTAPHYTHFAKRHSDGYTVGKRTDKLSEQEFATLQGLMETSNPGQHKWIVFKNYSEITKK